MLPIPDDILKQYETVLKNGRFPFLATPISTCDEK
jgi:hypothetical protein